MKKLENGARQLEKSRGSNGYVLPVEDAFVVVDPGMASGAVAVIAELESAGMLGSLSHILLTHYDVDHAGAALKLAQRSGAQVWIGHADADILAGRRPPGTVSRRIMTMVGRPKLPDPTHYLGESPGFAAGIRAVPTPGHTPGHFAFVWKESVFSGDAVMIGKDGAFKQFPSLLITNKADALASTETLRSLNTRWICPGHGAVTALG